MSGTLLTGFGCLCVLKTVQALALITGVDEYIVVLEKGL